MPAVADQAVNSQGTLLQRQNPSSLVYETIPEVNDFDGPGGDSPDIDVTPLDETQARHFRTGLADPGNLTFNIQLNLGLALHAALYDDCFTTPKPVRNWKVVFNDTHGFSFSGTVKTARASAPKDNVIKTAAAIRITGAIVRF